MRLRRFFLVPLLLTAVAVLALLLVLDHTDSGASYRQATASEVASLINQGQVNRGLISDGNQTIQIITKSGKRLEASWASGQGPQLQHALQAQLDKGNLPGGYNVTTSRSNDLVGVLGVALIILTIALLLLWGADYQARFRGWRALAGQAGHMALRRVQQI